MLFRRRINKCTKQENIGTPKPEKREQLAFLADRIEIEGLPCPPIAGVEGHPIYKQAKAYPYEDISAYFRMVDEEVRQRGEGAKVTLKGTKTADVWSFDKPATRCEPGACVPHDSCDWCAVCGKSGKVIVWEKRLAAQSNMRDVEKAFAELGRIVGEHAGSPLLNADGCECEMCGNASVGRFCSLPCLSLWNKPIQPPVLTESPAPTFNGFGRLLFGDGKTCKSGGPHSMHGPSSPCVHCGVRVSL